MKKTKRIYIRIDEDSLDQIRQSAQGAGLKTSVFIRDLAVHHKIVPVIPADIRKNINGFSRNLNQLAHHCNTHQDAPASASLEALRAEAFKIIQAINSNG